MEKKNNITPFETDIAKWYSDLVLQSDLISYAPVKGTMFFKPYGFKVWTLIKEQMTTEFIKHNVEEVQFPTLIPESLLQKEKNHVEGFAPELYTVTRTGNKELNENLIIRPTSETLFGEYFREELNSYKQLPMNLNQWVSVMRLENNTRPFLRNSEFLWQEGHTIHATKQEAKDFSYEIIKLYENFAKDALRLPVQMGMKSKNERFAGAEMTFTIETILKDGQALQSGTSHYLRDNFTKAFNVKVLGSDNKMYNPFGTSWGVSTRLIGALIMTHSDNSGLVLPSKVAPYQVVISTVLANKDPMILVKAQELADKLGKDYRVHLDSTDKGPGFKARNWEVKGVPLRIEIGPRDIENNTAVMTYRTSSEKVSLDMEAINIEFIKKALEQNDSEIYSNATKIVENKIIEANSLEEVSKIIQDGNIAKAYWTEDDTTEKQLKDDTGATLRLLNVVATEQASINTSESTQFVALIGRSY